MAGSESLQLRQSRRVAVFLRATVHFADALRPGAHLLTGLLASLNWSPVPRSGSMLALLLLHPGPANRM